MRIDLENPFTRTQATSPIAPIETDDKQESTFGAHLAASLQTLESSTVQADRDAEGMITGEVDLHTAMISMEKADIMLKVGSTVRNKLLDAYRQLTQIG